jgi:hypothetical protein
LRTLVRTRILCEAMRMLAVATLCVLLAACTAPGTVPAASMSVSIENGTTLPVTVVVNDAQVATVAPGDDATLPSSQMPSLPWNVEARSPSGRVLVSLVVHDGDVVHTQNRYDGDAARVDLSCGRLDIWSGPPLLGPAPGPGSPGDCAP